MGNAEGTGAVQARLLAVVESPPHNSFGNSRRIQELELKLAEVRKDYAELHTELFEAAQVHRRLCAPRLVRYGNFEIVNEIFAVRHLAGDFFTIEETEGHVVFAFGD